MNRDKIMTAEQYRNQQIAQVEQDLSRVRQQRVPAGHQSMRTVLELRYNYLKNTGAAELMAAEVQEI